MFAMAHCFIEEAAVITTTIIIQEAALITTTIITLPPLHVTN